MHVQKQVYTLVKELHLTYAHFEFFATDHLEALWNSTWTNVSVYPMSCEESICNVGTKFTQRTLKVARRVLSIGTFRSVEKVCKTSKSSENQVSNGGVLRNADRESPLIPIPEGTSY
jgi:hypothetical protein